MGTTASLLKFLNFLLLCYKERETQNKEIEKRIKEINETEKLGFVVEFSFIFLGIYIYR